MPNRTALQVCVVFLHDNDILYIPPVAGAPFNLVDYGRSLECFALVAALDRRYRAPIPYKVGYSTRIGTTSSEDEEVELE